MKSHFELQNEYSGDNIYKFEAKAKYKAEQLKNLYNCAKESGVLSQKTANQLRKRRIVRILRTTQYF